MMVGIELSPKQTDVLNAVFEGEVKYMTDKDAEGHRVRASLARLRDLNLVEADVANNEWAPTKRACILRNDGDI